MNEHLFKLKEGGKVVGYLKIDRGLVCWKTTTLSAALNETWHTVHNSARIDFDTAHPFVTKDKNGKDVFAGDMVSFVLAEGFGVTGRYIGIVYYCEKRLAFCVNALPAWDVRIKYNCSDIELIEDKKDE